MHDLDVIYEDNDLLVINKEAGLVVNTSNTSPTNTLQEQLAKIIEKSDEEEENDFDQRSGIAHRLDKDTSGVLLIAKNKEAFLALQHQFKARQVKKEYEAVVLGRIGESVIEIDAPIGRHPHVRTKFAIVAGGKDSVTRIEKIKEISAEGETLTVVRVFPHTGRTHQIRVHLASFGHPIVGDEIYASTKQYFKWQPIFGRLMLHACKIEILHPTTHQQMTFEAPLPELFLDLSR